MKKYSLILVIFLLAGECADPCKDVVCENGTCVSGSCECDEGWTGALCDVDMCAGINCVNGDCEEGVCVCDNDAWAGTLCDECTTDCGTHGSCNDAGACICTDGYTGANCETAPVTSLCSNSCEYANDGECDDGGPDADYSACDCGTDCADCGTRSAVQCSGGSTNNAAIAVWYDGTDGPLPCNTQRIDVYIEDVFEGFLDSYYTSQPACADAGTVTTEVVAGSHTVYAECNDGDTYWGPQDFSVESGYCLLISLGPNKSLSVKKVKMKLNLFKN